MKRVVVTGAGGITALGGSWQEIKQSLEQRRSAVRYMQEWECYEGLQSRLLAPLPEALPLGPEYTRKRTRSMGRVALLSTLAADRALEDAGLKGSGELKNGSTGLACGSCMGSLQPIFDCASLFTKHTTADLTSSTYLQIMPHTTAVNTALFFGIRGRIITTSSACTSSSQAIGFSYEGIREGRQTIMVAGGAEELSVAYTAIFDTLFATSLKNDDPTHTPRPFDVKRDGLVLGEGGAALILEEREHALARGAKIYAEVVGYATNCDATHVTNPCSETMQICMELALKDAGLSASAVGYVNGHGTATELGDIAESTATSRLYGDRLPFSTFKGNFGHTLGACGALEAWLTIQMMNQEVFYPTLNLEEPDPRCGQLDYLIGADRALSTEYVQSNNFAFGGINTSLIFKRAD
ncbi:MAG: beta-ketoacyl-ACP synthase [Succinivibrio sp.]|nr:beta-ketoacyl-ACP synthase [Succinivibrio sp.]